ncbi:MAG: B12-binding domain-containing radical SAM protein [Armatimonadota bacterium]
MAAITLVNPNRMKPAVAPIGLDYLAEALALAGHRVSILDLCFSDDWQADIAAHFATTQADLVGMTIRNTDDCYFASQDCFLPYFKEVIATIRAHTEAPVVVGGAGFSVAPAAITRFVGADYAVHGEGEGALPLLASRLQNGESLAEVPNLIYRDDVGNCITNPPAFQDLATIPPRSRRWLDNRRYFVEGGQAGIETKRGCPGRCIYCADPLGKGRVCRLRPPEYVVREMRALVDQGVDCFHLCDAEFNMPLRHALDVCRAIIDSGLAERMSWYTYASPAPFTDELAGLMKSAGCLGINFGADHGDDVMLSALGRDYTAEDIRRTAEICHRHGITVMFDMLFGGPGETRESVRRSIDLLKSLNPARVGLSVGIRVYAGTKMADLARRQGLSSANPALHGQIEGNDDLVFPIYYLAPEVGLEVNDYIADLVANDSRFLHASPRQTEGNYNYNENDTLVQAIARGHRGAYWDILRRVQEEATR